MSITNSELSSQISINRNFCSFLDYAVIQNAIIGVASYSSSVINGYSAYGCCFGSIESASGIVNSFYSVYTSGWESDFYFLSYVCSSTTNPVCWAPVCSAYKSIVITIVSISIWEICFSCYIVTIFIGNNDSHLIISIFVNSCSANSNIDGNNIACNDFNSTISSAINRNRTTINICCKSSRWNESERERCHRYQRHNLLRDLIQLYSLPINFLRNLAPPQWGAGLFSLHPAWSVPYFSCRSRFATGKTCRQNKKPSAFAGLAARFRPVRPRPRQRLRPGLVESSRLGDMLWLYSPFR